MIVERNNVQVSGKGRAPMVFVHGFGCDQTMWRAVAPAFEADYRVVAYDLTGMGRSELSAYDPARYQGLPGHADDLLEILDTLSLTGVTLVGHSVGASIALIAANRRPDLVSALVLVAPSPCFLRDEPSGYDGGFGADDLEGLVSLLAENQLGWSTRMGPTIAGQPEDGPQAAELTQSFCRTDPTIMQHFGRVTFFADVRDQMRQAAVPPLIVQCDQDTLVPMRVADWMKSNIPDATLDVLHASGHCPHMTVPDQVVASIKQFLGPV